MGRKLRFVPPGGAVVEVTTRTVQERFLLRPDRQLNDIVIGLLARAQKKYPVEIHAFVAMSNHIHLLLSVATARRLSRFMRHFNGNLSKEVGRMRGWSGQLWGRRYSSIVVSDEPEAQESRLRYLLEQGTKEGLVDSPRRWPGATALPALLGEAELTGTWVDRTGLCRASRGRKAVDAARFRHKVTLILTPLPCWKTVLPADRCRRIRAMVEEIEAATADRHRKSRTQPLGKRAVLKADPTDRPRESARSPRPAFHTASVEAWLHLDEDYRSFADLYHEAAGRLARGKRPSFPPGCCPAALPVLPRRPPDPRE